MLNSGNASFVEIFWTAPAALAFLLTVLMVGWVMGSFGALRAKIKESPELYRAWGPRWNFILLLTGSLGCFALGWLGYCILGVIAMLTPPPISEEVADAAQVFPWVLISMEICQVVAQALLWGAFRALASLPFFPRSARHGVPPPDSMTKTEIYSLLTHQSGPSPMQEDPP